MEVKGVIKTPNHYNHVNVVVGDLPEDKHCKDIVIAQQIQVLKPGSNKIAVIIRNLYCRTLKLKKQTKIGHVEASNTVPSMVSSQIPKNIPKQGCGKYSNKYPTQEPTQREKRQCPKYL